MTFSLFGIKVQITITKVEKFNAAIDQAQRQADTSAIINSDSFKAIKEQAARARALREIQNTEFGRKMIDNIARG